MKAEIHIGALLIAAAASLAGCGGGGGDASSTTQNLSLIGGTRQGAALSLTATVTTYAGAASTSGSTDASGTSARFNNPSGITTDGTNLYVVEMANHTIRKVVIASAAVSTLAGTAGSSGTADGTGAAAQFLQPRGITTDGTYLYVADSSNHSIRKVEISSGAVTTLAGTSGSFGTTDGTGSAARFRYPYGVTTDGTNLYVTDGFNNTIRKVVISTGVVTTLAGTAGTSGTTDGTGTAALFSSPYGITTDGTNLYVADKSNHTVRKIVISSGVVTTLAGTAGTTGTTDGTGTAALFNQPIGITTDGTNLYVSEQGNHTLRKVVISTGVVTTLAGTAGTSGTTDGTGTAAKFNIPFGLTSDGSALYVGDFLNHTIRKLR